MLPVPAHTRNQGYRIVRRFLPFTVAATLALAALLSPASLIRTVRADPGALDLSFGQNGEVVVWPAPSLARIAIQPDGKIVVACLRTFRQGRFVAVSRYLQSGALDWVRIVADTLIPAGDWVQLEVLIRPDGKIVVAFQIDRNSKVVVLHPNGSVDTSFGSGGHLSLTHFEDVDVLHDNRLVALGLSSLHVFDSNGALVSTVFLPYPTSVGHGRLAVGRDGRLVVASTSLLTRYNADLTPDNSFCAGGPCLSPLPSINYLKVANDGKIVTGSSVPYSGFPIARHLPNGDVDLAFGTSGVFNVGTAYEFNFSALEVDDTGRILVSLKTMLPGGYIRIIAADGSSAEYLQSGPTFLEHIGDIALQEDGKLLVSGFAFNLDGTILRRHHYADTRTTAANLRFDTTRITPRNISPGDEIMYTIKVVNDGPNKAGHVTFENPLPNGTSFVSFEAPEGWVTYQSPRFFLGKVSCSAYRLESGQSATFRLTVRVRSNVAQGTEITNTSTVDSLVNDPIQSNNTTTSTVTVQ